MSVSKNLIVDLLNSLIKDYRDISWKMGTGLHNGLEVSVYEIIVYEIRNNRTISRIAFDGNSGRILNLKMKGYKQQIADNIVDALLDCKNFIKEQMF